ncbi:Forkhead transcription factor [Rhizina undulata]
MGSTRPPLKIHRDAPGPFRPRTASATAPSPTTATNATTATSTNNIRRAISTASRSTTTNTTATTISHSAAAQPTQSAAFLRSASVTSPLRYYSSSSLFYRPPIVGPTHSPLKRRNIHPRVPFPSSSLFRNSFDRISIPPPEPDAFTTDSPMKKPPVTRFDTSTFAPKHMSSRRPQAALFTSFPSSKATGKENMGRESSILQSSELFGIRQALAQKTNTTGAVTRSLMEAAPIREKRQVKEKKTGISSSPTKFLQSRDPPDIVDDGKKPPYSYATLIGMAILRAPNRRLTLAQIYKWIGDTFLYYRTSNNGWQNSIRHNLSLNKAFVKQERPKDDPGKGNYWVVEKGCDHLFMKNKSSRKTSSGSSKKSALPKATLGDIEHFVEAHHREIQITFENTDRMEHGDRTDNIHESPARDSMQDLLALSSDATRSASPELDDMSEDEDFFRPLSPQAKIAARSSPPSLCSSPPLTRNQIQSVRDATPPPFFPEIRKRKLSSLTMNDSGYFSSIESSALRTNNEEDRPRVKRGRAEEDIARIRGTNPESPIRRSTIPGHASSSFFISSPLRNHQPNPMLPPLTPATHLPPPKPPMSASPNTHLRLHRDRVRQLVKSPSRDIGVLEDDAWSTVFASIANEYYGYDNDDSVQEEFEDIISKACYGSPDKREAKRREVRRSYGGGLRSADLLGEAFLEPPDLFGVDVYGVIKNGFERFQNDGQGSPLSKLGDIRTGEWSNH